ncbi:MAG: hypothetical protein CFH34_00997 [Alphaproteobacteria bacterium MarineAlpha9_Bin4]|nr:hypothetical protein [Pelagibacterales bacterium]PPR26361.1 MAG: hypothetical protein CFH34_00997 [Alphaproteobacteria bacterium MarineAlpha9_Bin4]|tara:strand:- start:771 stop:1262 length:492 start_codon:yes stop_codon:yes gene_type:complete
MKFFIFFIAIIYISISIAEDKNLYLETTASGSYVTFKSMNMKNGTNVIHYENDMAWTDNFGNYGSAFCYGSFISKNKVYTKFDLYCENKNQNGHILWSYYTRPNTEYDAGTGEAFFVDGNGDYENLVGLKCIFSTKYFEKKIFSKTKCKISAKQKEFLSRMSK